jgi:hypothetical protein
MIDFRLNCGIAFYIRDKNKFKLLGNNPINIGVYLEVLSKTSVIHCFFCS